MDYIIIITRRKAAKAIGIELCFLRQAARALLGDSRWPQHTGLLITLQLIGHRTAGLERHAGSGSERVQLPAVTLILIDKVDAAGTIHSLPVRP